MFYFVRILTFIIARLLTGWIGLKINANNGLKKSKQGVATIDPKNQKRMHREHRLIYPLNTD